MKTSTEIQSIANHVGEEKAVEMVAKAGFDAWDFSMFSMARYNGATGTLVDTDHPLHSGDHVAFAKRLRRIGEENGIVCNQSHAPFPSHLPEVRDRLKRAIECTAIAGGEICIIHPDNNKDAQQNAEFYLELLPFAKQHGVKIATENMFNWDRVQNHASPAACSSVEDFVAHVRAVNDPYLVACLDIAHAEIMGPETSAVRMIHALAEQRCLAALHLHDNDKHFDRHLLPFTMSIDYDAVMRALAQVNYQGYITLEAACYLENCDKSAVFEGVKQMASAARRIADTVDRYRQEITEQ